MGALAKLTELFKSLLSANKSPFKIEMRFHLRRIGGYTRKLGEWFGLFARGRTGIDRAIPGIGGAPWSMLAT